MKRRVAETFSKGHRTAKMPVRIADCVRCARGGALGQKRVQWARAMGSNALRQGKCKSMQVHMTLKVNTDLRIYRARKKTRDGDRMRDFMKKKQMYRTAEDLFQQIIASDAKDGRAYVGLAKVLERQKKFDNAKQVLENGSAATGGGNAYIWQVWGCLESAQGNVARARQLFDAAVVADKNLASAWQAWAQLEKREGNIKKAKKLLLKCLAAAETKKKPRSHIYVALARLAEDCEDVEAARAWYKLGVASGNVRDCSPAFNSWAILEAKNGNEEQARELFEKGLKGAKSRYAWLSLGSWELRWKNIEKAREILGEAAELFPSDVAIAQAHANSYTKGDHESKADMEKARTLFEKATQVDRYHQPVWHAWAIAEWEVAGDPNKARELFQQGIWNGPSTSQASRLFLSWANLEAREDANIQLARSLYSCATKIAPNNIRIFEAWSRTEELIGNGLRASELNSIAREIASEYTIVSTTELGSLLPRDVAKEVAPSIGQSENQSEVIRSITDSLESLEIEVKPVLKDFIAQWNAYFDKKARLGRAKSPSKLLKAFWAKS